MPYTPRQQAILDFIREEQQTRGITPSTRDIQQHFGFSSQTTVMDHLNALKRKGALLVSKGVARSFVLPETLEQLRHQSRIARIPLYGSIPAGMPSENHQEPLGCIAIDEETLRLPRKASTFALKVRGDSMTGAGILEGDIVIMEFKPPRSGDIVAALIDGETTLKRFMLVKNKPMLRAENPNYRDLIPAKELVIQGVMIALVRSVG